MVISHPVYFHLPLPPLSEPATDHITGTCQAISRPRVTQEHVSVSLAQGMTCKIECTLSKCQCKAAMETFICYHDFFIINWWEMYVLNFKVYLALLYKQIRFPFWTCRNDLYLGQIIKFRLVPCKAFNFFNKMMF